MERRGDLGCVETGSSDCGIVAEQDLTRRLEGPVCVGQCWRAAGKQLRCNPALNEPTMTLFYFLQIHADFHCDKDDRVWWGLEVFWKNLCIIEATSVENAVFIDNPAASPAIPDHLHDSIIDQI